MRVKTKSLIMMVCALMIVSSMAFGTIAYLTDRAGVTNRFTIGNVDIVVDETEVDENGDPIPNPDYDPDDPDDPDDPYERTEEENEYPLIPGSSYIKDPTLTIKRGSEQSYVRMVVTISNALELKMIFSELSQQYPLKFPNGFVPDAHVTGWNSAIWQFIRMAENEEANTFTLEFRYPAPVKPSSNEDLTLPPLFETICVPGELTNAHLNMLTNFAVEVNGNAIQTTGFSNADEAWAAFDAQMAATGT